MFPVKQPVRLKIKKKRNVLRSDLANSLVDAGATYGQSKLN